MMTRQDLERVDHKVQGTYRGPLDWELCTGLYNDLQQCRLSDGTHVFPVGTLRIVRQDPGFNIVTVEAPKPIIEMTPGELVTLRRRELREHAVELGYELMEAEPDDPGSPYASCVRCYSKATWDINGYPYCETCAPVMRQRHLASEGVIFRFHSPTGLVWCDGGLYPADFGDGRD